MARKKPRSAAQKAATRKLVALNKSRRSGGHKRRASAPRTRTVVMTSNPAPRPHKKRRSTKRAAHHAGRVLRYRRNPAVRPSSGGGVVGLLKDASLGAAGSIAVGLAVDKIIGMLPPSVPRSPEVAAGVTLLGALGVAALAAKVGHRAAGRAVAVGAITVAADKLARLYIAKAQAPRVVAMPAQGVNGMELDYSMSDGSGMGMYMGEYNEVGEYINQ